MLNLAQTAACLFLLCSFVRCQEISKKTNNDSPDQASHPTNNWSSIVIDSLLPKDTAFKKLNIEEDGFHILMKGEKSDLKTSNVIYYKDENNTYTLPFICKSYLTQPDTIKISIGVSSGLGGYGFGVSLLNKKFKIVPYEFTDVIYPEETTPEPTYEIINQKLILNKKNYKLGDSIFGFIDFKIIESIYEDKHSYTGKGYFRSKVKESYKL